MKNQRRQAVTIAIACTCAVLAAVACGGPKPAQKALTAAAMPECPHDHADSMSHGRFAKVVAFAGLRTDVPEFHDCQRFIADVGKGPEYHDLEAIFVSNLDSVFGVRTGNGDLVSAATTALVTKGVPVAVIYSEGNYDQLGIVQGYDCLVMQRKKTSGYEAWMIPINSTADCNGLSHPAPGIGTKLAVDTIAPQNNNGKVDEVPPVARWDWDPVKKWHYIGLKCATSWCEVHWETGTFHSSVTYVSNGANDQVYRVKGWYDEQYLAAPQNSLGSVLPDGAIGTVVPVPELGARTVKHYSQTDSTWVRVAWVLLDVPSDKYYKKYGYEATTVAAAVSKGTRNEVSFCLQTTTKSCGTDVTSIKNCPVDSVNNGTWYARIKSASGASLKYFCVKYRPLPGNVQPPGVVRWRWKIKDETIWVSCPNGCCEVDPDLS